MVRGLPDYYAIIGSVRDVIHRPVELILNPNFEQDLTGWIYENATIITRSYAIVPTPYGKAVRFSASTTRGTIAQFFGIGVSTNWFSSISFDMRSPSTGNTLVLLVLYNGNTYDSQIYNVTVVNTWQTKTYTPTANKIVKMIQFYQFDNFIQVDLDDILLVF